MSNLFIVGSPRSGTTYLSNFLTNSKYGKPFETCFIIKYYKKLYRYSPLNRSNVERLLNDLSSERYIKQWRIKLLADDISIFQGDDTKTYLNVVNYICRQVRGKKNWSDKTPLYIQDWELLNELFPNSLYIYIVRDGRDVALSLIKKPWGPNNIYSCSKLWSEQNSNIKMVQKLTKEKRILTMKYEELVRNPKEKAKNIMDFIGEEYEDNLIEKIGQNTLSNNYDKWKNNLTNDQLNLFDYFSQKQLSFFNYELHENLSPPSSFKLIFYRIHNFTLYWFHNIDQNIFDWFRMKFRKKQPFND